MSLAVFTDSTTAQASPAFTLRPASGSSTNTTSVNSLCAWSVMPTVAVSPLTRTHSCDLAYLRSEGMLLINCARRLRRFIQANKPKMSREEREGGEGRNLFPSFPSRPSRDIFSPKHFLVHHAFGNFGHAA